MHIGIHFNEDLIYEKITISNIGIRFNIGIDGL